MPRKNKITAAPHIWKPGHDPNDPDAHPDSGWEYITIREAAGDTTFKNDKYTKGGGPESGLPCMNCQAMTRIVDEVPVLDILDQNVEVDGEGMKLSFTPEQRARYAKEKVAILLCPQCDSITQMRADIVKVLRTKYELRKKE